MGVERGARRVLALAPAVLSLFALALRGRPAADRPLTWDEVDYVVAARAGTWANLSDRGALAPMPFLRFALAKAGYGDAQAVATAASYVENESLLHLRHWHPPGGLLLLPPAIAAVGPERGARVSQLFWAWALALALIGVLRDLAPRRPLLRGIAVALVLLDPLTRHALLEAHVQVAVAAALLLPLWCWLRVVRDPLDGRRLGALREAARPGPPTAPMAGRAGALVFGLTLGALWSVAVIGPIWSALWVGLLLLHRDARDWLAREGGGLWLGVGTAAAVAVLWPGGIVRLGLLQTHALRLYAVLFHGGSEWRTAGAALVAVVRRDPALVLYAASGIAALVVGVARGRRDALGAGAAAVAFLTVILPFAIIDRYLLPLVPLGVVAGVALAGPGDPERGVPGDPVAGGAAGLTRRGAVVAVAAVLLCWRFGAGFPYPDRARGEALREEYRRVDALAAQGEEVLAEGGHIFRYYADATAATIRPVLVDYDGERLLLREGVRYDTVSTARPAWVVLQRREGEEPPVFAALGARCRREDLPTHVHFACGDAGGGG